MEALRIDTDNLEGIVLTSLAHPDFDALVSSLFRGDSSQLLELKPFLAVISNRTEKTLAAFTLNWELKRPRGARLTRSDHKYPDAVAPAAPDRGNELRAGEQRVVAMGIELEDGRSGRKPTSDVYLAQFASMFREYHDVTALRISLDAAIFADGEWIGPGISGLDAHFAADVREKQNLYRLLLKGLDAGKAMEDVFGPIEDARSPGRLPPRDPLAMYSALAAQQVSQWRDRHGDAAMPEILRRALRAEPFEIRRFSRTVELFPRKKSAQAF
jgi:hypothetical protein